MSADALTVRYKVKAWMMSPLIEDWQKDAYTKTEDTSSFGQRSSAP